MNFIRIFPPNWKKNLFLNSSQKVLDNLAWVSIVFMACRSVSTWMPNSSVLLFKVGLSPGETRRGEICSSVLGFSETLDFSSCDIKTCPHGFRGQFLTTLGLTSKSYILVDYYLKNSLTNQRLAEAWPYCRRWYFSLERWRRNGGYFSLRDQVRLSIINLSGVLLARLFAFIENLILLFLTKVAATTLYTGISLENYNLLEW